jgi:hypothetical protein
MLDLKRRFECLDRLDAPDLWADVEDRSELGHSQGRFRRPPSVDHTVQRGVLVALATAVVVLTVVGFGTWLLSGSMSDSQPVITQDTQVITQDTTPTNFNSTPPDTTILPSTLDEGAGAQLGLHPGGGVAAAIDAEGRLVVAYWSSASEALTVVRCEDSVCRGESHVATLAQVPSVEIENALIPGLVVRDIVLRPDGSPIIVATHADRPSATVYACVDPVCTTVRTLEIGENVDPQLAIGPDGLVRIAYYEMFSQEVKLATCGDPLCESGLLSTVIIDDDIPGWVVREPSIWIDSDGLIVVGYTVEMSAGVTEARVAVCRDDSCSAEPLAFKDATGPRISMSGGDRFDVWYRSGPLMLGEGDAPDASAVVGAWDLMLADCDRTGCREASQVEADWRLLGAWTDNARLLKTPDETVAVAFQYFSSESCAELLTLMTLESQPGVPGITLGSHQTFGHPFESVTRDEAVLLIFAEEDGKLRVVEASTTDLVGTPLPVVPQCPNP